MLETQLLRSQPFCFLLFVNNFLLSLTLTINQNFACLARLYKYFIIFDAYSIYRCRLVMVSLSHHHQPINGHYMTTHPSSSRYRYAPRCVWYVVCAPILIAPSPAATQKFLLDNVAIEIYN